MAAVPTPDGDRRILPRRRGHSGERRQVRTVHQWTQSQRPAPVHVVALAECGTHAIVAAAIGPRASDERALAGPLLDACEPGTLVTADRNFYSFGLWQRTLATGADLLWRVKSDLTLPVVQPLPDGSYLSVVINPKISGKRRDQLVAVDGTVPCRDPARRAGDQPFS